MVERRINENEDDVRQALDQGEVIREYPDDQPHPSRLVLGRAGSRPIHVVAADDPGAGETIVITVYEPDPTRWEPGIQEEAEAMKCVVCKHGETQPGCTTVTLERGAMTLVVKGVPARVCQDCGEEYVDEETAGRLLKAAEDAARAGVQVEVRQYVAA